MGDEHTWEPISEPDLTSLIAEAEDAMSKLEPAVGAFWRLARIRPVKWHLSPWGDLGGGFWVVALIGQTCLWYNDIEDGFNVSRFEVPGRIADYWCNQAELQHCVAGFLERLGRGGPQSVESGVAVDGGGTTGSPES